MASKLDDFMKLRGGNISESIGQGGGGSSASIGRREPSKQTRGVRRGDLLEIEVDRIYPDPDQPRKEFDPDSIGRMAESLRSRGQIQPVMVRWCMASERWLIVSGERRWRGAMQAGLKSMKAVVRESRPGSEPGSDGGDILVEQLVENLVREDLTPLEQAHAFRRLMTVKGWSGVRLSKELGITQPRVVEALALLELPAAIRERLELELITATSAYEISKVADPVVQERLAAAIAGGSMTRDDLRDEVRKVTARKGGARNPGKGRGVKAGPPKPWKFRASSGVKVTLEYPRGRGEDDARDALAEALERFRARAEEAA